MPPPPPLPPISVSNAQLRALAAEAAEAAEAAAATWAGLSDADRGLVRECYVVSWLITAASRLIGDGGGEMGRYLWLDQNTRCESAGDVIGMLWNAADAAEASVELSNVGKALASAKRAGKGERLLFKNRKHEWDDGDEVAVLAMVAVAEFEARRRPPGVAAATTRPRLRRGPSDFPSYKWQDRVRELLRGLVEGVEQAGALPTAAEGVFCCLLHTEAERDCVNRALLYLDTVGVSIDEYGKHDMPCTVSGPCPSALELQSVLGRVVLDGEEYLELADKHSDPKDRLLCSTRIKNSRKYATEDVMALLRPEERPELMREMRG